MCFGRSRHWRESRESIAMGRDGAEKSAQDVFVMWEAEENGICGAIQTLLALPKPGRDRLLRRPGRKESLGQHWHS